RGRILEEFSQAYQNKENSVGSAVLRQIEKSILLQSLDAHWREHLAAMDHLRQGIHLRGYAQKNPKQEYKREAFELFSQLLDQFKFQVLSILSKIQVTTQEDAQLAEQQRRSEVPQHLVFQHAETTAMATEENPAPEEQSAATAPFTRSTPKVGRNESCPCGSGKKYKQCHGKLA